MMGAAMDRARKRSLASILPIGVVLALLVAAPASADAGSFEVREYTRDFNVPAGQAEETLEVQDSGAEADIAGQLEERLGSRYAGVWFDNESGEFVVPLLPNASGAAVSDEFSAADLSSGDFRTVPAEYSWASLEAAQEQMQETLAVLAPDDAVSTSIDPRTNAVVVYRPASMSEAAEQELNDALAEQDVRIEVRQEPEGQLTKIGCIAEIRICSKPLRGGVAMWQKGVTELGFIPPICSAGFKAIGTSNGNRYLLTAGHCAEEISEWTTFDADKFAAHYIGPVEQWTNNGGDWAKINVTGRPYWDEGSWPTQVAYWGTDQERAITGEGSSFVGQQACHAGLATGASCGTVTELDKSITLEGKSLNHYTEVQGVCADEGDSGGPVFLGNTALGIAVVASIATKTCNGILGYVEITEATNALGVSVGPKSPHVTVETIPLNGNPGWVTIRGQVTAPNTTINGKNVNVKLFKWEGNSWVLKTTLGATVNNNAYEISNWNGVGKGSWLAKTVFPSQSPFGEATSDETKEGSFTIKDGYQLVNTYSGKCLDVEASGTANGVNMQQWDCGNPATALNQVFTLVPKGNYLQLVARHSNRCADVINESYANGAWIEQWDCLGEQQQNQIWLGAPVSGTPYVNFKAKHSGKCLEIGGPSSSNGAKAQQWDCLGASQTNQLWGFKSVESGPVPTKTTEVVTQVLHGQPGWVTVEGEVTAGAYAINGSKVNVNFSKKISGNWTYIATAQATVSNGHFAVPNYVVGVGDWKVKAVFTQQGSLGESSSGEPEFTVKKGYQLINKYSNKCLDVENGGTTNGVNMQQWTCGNPGTSQNQVFTLVPRGNSYYQIVANHSGRCADVINQSYANGAWIEQWDCLGDTQTNQIWQGVPMAGGYTNFRAKHSGKCLEIGGPSSNNGAKAQQWDCLGDSQKNQLWAWWPVTW